MLSWRCLWFCILPQLSLLFLWADGLEAFLIVFLSSWPSQKHFKFTTAANMLSSRCLSQSLDVPSSIWSNESKMWEVYKYMPLHLLNLTHKYNWSVALSRASSFKSTVYLHSSSMKPPEWTMFLGAHQPAASLWFNFSLPFPGLQLFILRMVWDGFPLLSQYWWLPVSFLSVLDIVTLTQSCVFLSRFLTLRCFCLVFSQCAHYFPAWFSLFILFHLHIFSQATSLSLLSSFFLTQGLTMQTYAEFKFIFSFSASWWLGLWVCCYFLRENLWRDQIPKNTIELVICVDLVIVISALFMWERGS